MNQIFGIKMVNPAEPKKGIAKEFFKDFSGLNSEVDYYVSNKVYEHREEGLNFDYRYAIGVMDMGEITGEEKICVGLCIVPEFKSLCQKNQDGLVKYFGFMDDIEPEPYDLIDYGECVNFAQEEFTYEEFEGKLDEVLDIAASVISTIDTFFGFYMDKPVNRIGTTGWDFAESWIDGSNPFTKVLDRYNENK